MATELPCQYDVSMCFSVFESRQIDRNILPDFCQRLLLILMSTASNLCKVVRWRHTT